MPHFNLKSMTAYGRASHTSTLGRFIVEIQCLNRKFLEMNLFFPKDFLRFEMEIRKQIAAKIPRGQVNVTLSYRRDPTQALNLQPNLVLVQSLKKAWETIGKEIHAEVEPSLLFQILSQEKEIIGPEEITEDKPFLELIKQLVDEALEKVIFMKKEEAQALVTDIRERLALLKSLIEDIAQKAPNASQKFYQKLKQRLTELFESHWENEDRLLKEVAIYTEKVDISEEITRFNSHLKQFDHFLNEATESPGKTLDFLLQELHREINTIGSKATDASISHLVVQVKSELEKIREQVQNLE